MNAQNILHVFERSVKILVNPVHGVTTPNVRLNGTDRFVFVYSDTKAILIQFARNVSM